MKRKTIHVSGREKLLADVQNELTAMERELLSIEGPGIPMNRDIRRVISSGGKRLRPILAYVCYKMGRGGGYPIRPLMGMIELMHTASLIHDDVVDGAALRRGSPTINATTGRDAAVHSGDYLLAEAMAGLHYYKGTGINEALIEASEAMCLGELHQLRVRHSPEKQTRAGYFRQIYAKTASLIAASCYTGAIAGGVPEGQARLLKQYGENLGISFQLADDLLDFSEKPQIGKKAGQDLRNGILTLPALYALEQGVPRSVKALFMKRDKTDGDIRRLAQYLQSTNALDHTRMLIREKTAEAIGALGNFPDSGEKAALTELAVRLTDRQA